MGAIEATEGIWDGAVPYVMANPMAVPNVFASRMHAVRVLGEEGLKKVTAAMEPGGFGDIYEGLDEMQKAALKEASMMGFPDRAWFCHPFMGDGALMALVGTIYQMFPGYFKEFWEKDGYEGADPSSDAVRDRMQHVTTVKEIIYEQKQEKEEDEFTSVDNSWVNTMLGGEPLPVIRINDLVPEGSYQFHCRLRVLSGGSKGAEINIAEIEVAAGKVTGAAWDYESSGDWSHEETLIPDENGGARIKSVHIFEKPGTYYPCLKVRANRNGDASDIFTQCKNLDRVKVVVG